MRRNTPKSIAAAVLSFAVLGIAGLLLAQVVFNRPQHNTGELVGMPPAPEQVRLYAPGAPGDLATSFEYLRGLNLSDRPYVRKTRANGDVLELYKRRDGTIELALEWYQTAPGESRRLKQATVYGADGKTLLGQVDFRKSGTREKRKMPRQKGGFETTSYYADGIARSDQIVTGHGPQDYDDDDMLLSETRWREDGSVSYTNVLNDDDSRSIVELDAQSRPLVVGHITNGLSGSTITAYFPGTNKPRILATSTYDTLTAKMFRPDGTLEVVVQLWSSSFNAVFYDATGKVETREGMWSFDRVSKGDAVTIANVHPTEIEKVDAQGNPVEEWHWQPGYSGPSMYEQYNVTVPNPVAGQPPVLCKRTASFYRQDGSLEKTDFMPADSSLKEWDVEHTPEEHLLAPQPPAYLLVPPAIDPALPVPEPYSGPY